MELEDQFTPNNLNTISQLSAQKAADSLSKLLNLSIDVGVAVIDIHSIKKMRSILTNGTLLFKTQISGGLEGTALFTFPKLSALEICNLLLHKKHIKNEITSEFTSTELDALNEVVNIFVGNFLNTFSAPLKIKSLMHSAPKLVPAELNGFIEKLISSALHRNHIIVISVEFQHEKIKSHGFFILHKTV